MVIKPVVPKTLISYPPLAVFSYTVSQSLCKDMENKRHCHKQGRLITHHPHPYLQQHVGYALGLFFTQFSFSSNVTPSGRPFLTTMYEIILHLLYSLLPLFHFSLLWLCLPDIILCILVACVPQVKCRFHKGQNYT